MGYKYLTKRGLDGLKAYQYKATGYTFLDNLHTPFLNCEHCSSSSSSRYVTAQGVADSCDMHSTATGLTSCCICL